MTTQPYTGVWPVAPTPFTETGALDLDGQRRVLDCMIDQGVDGICILANYSEQFLLSDEERATLTRLCLEHVGGRVPINVTCSHFSTAIVEARAREAASLGAAMIMLMPPYHGATAMIDEAAVLSHFERAAAAADIPVMVQDAPLSGVALRVAFLAEMARKIPSLSYFKIETPQAAAKLRALIEAAGEAIEGPFDGEESITLMADLEAGATGTMCSALQPDLIKKVVATFAAGRHDEAADHYAAILPLINYENRQCGLRACKTVMMEGGVIKSDHVRHPLAPLHPATREGLLKLARQAKPLALTWGR
ncbi:MAG: dihydrodipicolinate synthase family protein [Pararhizobium sp.]